MTGRSRHDELRELVLEAIATPDASKYGADIRNQGRAAPKWPEGGYIAFYDYAHKVARAALAAAAGDTDIEGRHQEGEGR